MMQWAKASIDLGSVVGVGGGDEMAQIHHTCWRYGRRMADCGEGAAGLEAGDWISPGCLCCCQQSSSRRQQFPIRSKHFPAWLSSEIGCKPLKTPNQIIPKRRNGS
jgi:hypothetical protein